MPAPAPSAGTISSIGAMANMPASGRAPIAALVDATGQRRALATERHPEMWLTAVETDGHGVVEDERLSSEEQSDEYLLMGLRLNEGIDLDRFEQLRGWPILESRIASLVADGMIERIGDSVRVTRAGLPAARCGGRRPRRLSPVRRVAGCAPRHDAEGERLWCTARSTPLPIAQPPLDVDGGHKERAMTVESLLIMIIVGIVAGWLAGPGRPRRRLRARRRPRGRRRRRPDRRLAVPAPRHLARRRHRGRHHLAPRSAPSSCSCVIRLVRRA